MEGHQQDSESDIRNKQLKKHTRKRTSNIMISDATNDELKRLSDVKYCSSTLHSEGEHFPSNNLNVEFINQLLLYKNKIPRNIVLHLPKLENDVRDKYLYTCYKNNQVNYPKSCFVKNDKTILRMPRRKACSRSLTRYNNAKLCNYSDIDVTTFFIFAKLLYETSQQLQRISKKYSQDTVPSNFLMVSNELGNVKNLLIPVPKHSKIMEIKQNYNRNYNYYSQITYEPDTLAKIKISQLIKFDVAIERHSIKLDLTLNKISVFLNRFIQGLKTFYLMSKMNTCKHNNNNTPCVIIRSWHFRNIIQGYLLGLLLRNLNVNSLNMMRKLYFVIITSYTTNLVIEITIKWKSGIFIVYDNCVYQDFIDWNKSHNVFIKRSISMAALENAVQYKINTRNQLRVITSHTNMEQCNPNITDEGYLSKAESKEDSCNSSYYSDTNSLHSKTSESSTVLLHRSHSSTFILSPEETAMTVDGKAIPSQQHAIETIFSNILNNNHKIYNANFLHSKQWLVKLFPRNKGNDSKDKLTFTNMIQMFRYNQLKESIFDRTSTHIRLLESVTDLYWKQVTSQSFYMLFIKSLGQSLSHIFFNTVF